MQIVSIGDNLHKMSNPVFCENTKNISKCPLMKIFTRVLSVNKYASKVSLLTAFQFHQDDTRVIMKGKHVKTLTSMYGMLICSITLNYLQS